MESVAICKCPYVAWCHETRQKQQESVRVAEGNTTMAGCPFYLAIRLSYQTSKK